MLKNDPPYKSRIKQLNKLSFLEWKTIIASTFLLPLIGISLKLFGLKRTQNVLWKCSPAPQYSSDITKQQLDITTEIARSVNISARHGLYKANCLKQVLMLRFLLNKRNIHTILHIGVKKDKEQKLGAHSWLEYAGIPLIDSKKKLQEFSTIHSSKCHKTTEKHFEI